MKKYFKSIHSNMLIGFLALIIPIVLLYLWLSVYFTKNSVIENSKQYTQQLMFQVNTTVDSYIDFMENISNITLNSGSHYTYLSNESDDDLLKYEILKQFSTIIETRDDIYSIGIIGENNRILLNDGQQRINKNIDVKEQVWYQRAMDMQGEIVLTAAHVQNIISDQYRWVVNLSSSILDPRTNRPIGVFWVDLNFNTLSDLCDGIDLGARGYVFVLDEHGNIVYHPQQELIYSGIKDEAINEVIAAENGSFIVDKNHDKLYTISKSSRTGWSFVGVSFMDQLLISQNNIQKVYVSIGILIVPLVIFISYLVSKKITQPIKLLKNSMREVEVGNFKPASPVLVDKSEIGRLGKTFLIMTEKIGSLMEEKLRDEQLKREAELKALQSQINPHFLYNTLDSIVWMAESNMNEGVILMTVSLARLLRASISKSSSVVKVWDEIKYCESYLTIQKQRYQEDLTYEIDVPEALIDYPIIKLTLQPLVENAIYHGIKNSGRSGHLIISGYETKNYAVVTVRDDGIGMDETTLENILVERKHDLNKSSLGVCNVHQRLQLYFGKDYGLSFESEKGIGTVVKVKIPKAFNHIKEEVAYDN